MNIPKSIVRWVAVLCLSACVTEGASSSPDVDGSDEELKLNPCAYTLCPVNTRCVVDPSNPSHAICEPQPDRCALVRCRAGTHCIDGACIPDEPKVFCGGIAAFSCPGEGTCVDDPSDSCDPLHGGADCGGMCVCPKVAPCKLGTRWDPSPNVCACVPGAICGNKVCGPDQFCCNASCGICAPRGGACIQIACDVTLDQ